MVNGLAPANHGLIVRALADAVAFTPPLIISEEQVHELFDKFTATLDDALEHLRKNDVAVA